jgi:hypothetical protein
VAGSSKKIKKPASANKATSKRGGGAVIVSTKFKSKTPQQKSIDIKDLLIK